MKGVNGMANESCMLTTFDNPYNPFTQFNQWLLFDKEKGYDSCEYLARIANTSDEMTDEENNREIESAINEIIKYDFRNIYKKVRRSMKKM
jgi:hypothetical protein